MRPVIITKLLTTRMLHTVTIFTLSTILTRRPRRTPRITVVRRSKFI